MNVLHVMVMDIKPAVVVMAQVGIMKVINVSLVVVADVSRVSSVVEEGMMIVPLVMVLAEMSVTNAMVMVR
jgi:hypothetical protein